MSSEVTPVHVAAAHGHLACLQLLAHAGGSLLLQDARQFTPLDCAYLNGHDNCIAYLNEIFSELIGRWQQRLQGS